MEKDSGVLSSRFYSISEIMKKFNLSDRTLRRLILTGELPAYKVGGGYRIREADLAEFLERSKVIPEKEGE